MRASVHQHITRASHERMPCPHARQRSVSHIGQELCIATCLPTLTLIWYADSGCPEFTKSRSYSGGVLNTPSACPRLALTGMPAPRRASLGAVVPHCHWCLRLCQMRHGAMDSSGKSCTHLPGATRNSYTGHRLSRTSLSLQCGRWWSSVCCAACRLCALATPHASHNIMC